MSNSGSKTSKPQCRPGLHLFACFLTLYTFFVVVVGGTVKSREAGLSIPEGFILHWIPNWWATPNLREEFFHRFLVGGLGTLVVAFSAAVYKTDSRPGVRKLAVALPAVVL